MTDTDRALITAAATSWRRRARQHDAFLHLGYPPAAAWARILWLLDQSDAEATMPVEVHRLRRITAARSRGSVRRMGWAG